MNKRSEQKPKLTGIGDNKVQGFVFGINLEGSEQVVMEGIKAFTSAMTKSGTVLSAPIARPFLPSAPADKPRSNAAAVIDEETIGEVADEQPDIDQQETEFASEDSPSNGTGSKRNYTFKAPTFLHDLDLRKGAKQLSDFMEEKGNPTETLDRYIVIAVWYKDYMDIAEFKIDHIWTAYGFLNWKAQFPENHSQPLRDLKKKNFVTKEKTGGYKVSWPGEQHVEKMNASQ